MSGYFTSCAAAGGSRSLGQMLRQLREEAQAPGWQVASAAKMDSTLLSKIETGRRLPTREQLTALARFFKVDPGPLEARRIAEDMRRWYGGLAEFEAATEILREATGEYRVHKPMKSVNKRARQANKSGNSK